MVLAGQGVRPDIVDPDYNNFAPRFGFTWRPPKCVRNFVVRGGAGIYYATDNFNEEQFKGKGPPFFQAQTLDGDPAHADPLHARHAAFVHHVAQLSPFTFDRLNRTPYLTQWSFGMQKSLGKDWLFEVEYAGSTGQQAAAAPQSERRAHRSDRHDPDRAAHPVSAIGRTC